MGKDQGTTNTDLADLMRDTNAKMDKMTEDLKASTENMKKANENIEKWVLGMGRIWEK